MVEVDVLEVEREVEDEVVERDDEVVDLLLLVELVEIELLVELVETELEVLEVLVLDVEVEVPTWDTRVTGASCWEMLFIPFTFVIASNTPPELVDNAPRPQLPRKSQSVTDSTVAPMVLIAALLVLVEGIALHLLNLNPYI